MTIEETVFKMTECANELFARGYRDESIVILQSIDRLCYCYRVDIPKEVVNLRKDLTSLISQKQLDSLKKALKADGINIDALSF